MPELDCIWAADFETTGEHDLIEDGYVRVYLWHARSLDGDKTAAGCDIESFMAFAKKSDVKMIWFHNLKFDGSFILNYILEQGWECTDTQERDAPSFSVLVTDVGAWMCLTLRFGRHVVKIGDSAKKFPSMSLQEIAEKIYHIEGKADLDLKKRRDPSY